jgi:hypothetical protein
MELGNSLLDKVPSRTARTLCWPAIGAMGPAQLVDRPWQAPANPEAKAAPGSTIQIALHTPSWQRDHSTIYMVVRVAFTRLLETQGCQTGRRDFCLDAQQRAGRPGRCKHRKFRKRTTQECLADGKRRHHLGTASFPGFRDRSIAGDGAGLERHATPRPQSANSRPWHASVASTSWRRRTSEAPPCRLSNQQPGKPSG